ncbi:O-acyltransferase, WSD1, N-terminal [Kalmanozyma brasiliensis GHG001]|uniref:Uncharacterized protein n=1 Tax=Kalmanozyma brasiliensis (strain GHG001) TaxID=1365824 RepID=V5ETJ5_KALBG|nr:O-acyltransferase, WSD1, N-terminal [Kalmanozyma brasiliensis GHG001]EST05354.1 O-acyltransferase, WSD1, N-terminal [Kalmanozyma brasiliensis GHG001]
MSTTADKPATASPAAKVKGSGPTATLDPNVSVKFAGANGSPKVQSSSRFARMNSITSLNLNGNGNGGASADGTTTPTSKFFYPLFPGIVSSLDESPWASGYNTPALGSTIHNVAERTEAALQKVVDQRKGGVLEQVAHKALGFAEYLERLIQWEIFSRANAIGGIDNMWLLMDGVSKFNPVCTATYTFKEPPQLQDIKDAILKQVDHFPKYKQKLADVGRFFHGTVFVDDANFDINHHMRAENLPGNAGRRELEAYASEFIAQDWDYTKPLWESILLENFVDEETGAKGACVIRGHHTMADGQGFIMSQLFITSLGPKLESMMADGAQLLSDAKQGKALPSRMNKKLASLDRYHGTIALQLVMITLYWTSWFVGFLKDLFGCVTLSVHTSFFFMMTFWRQRYVTASYPGPRKHEKEFSISKSIPLSDVKLISKAFSGPQPGTLLDKVQGGKRVSRPFIGTHLTVNDIICTVIADVINDELDRQRDQPGWFNAVKRVSHKILPSPIGIMIPISIREPGDWSLRNLSTGGIAYLPTTSGLSTETKTLHKRLHTTHSRLNILKNSLLPKIAFHLVQLTGQLPFLYPVPFGLIPKHPLNATRWPTTWVTERILTCFTAVVTNVPCPSKQRITLAGQEVVRWTALPPQAGKGTLGIGICSYGGDFSISISADKVEGSEGVAAKLTESFERRWSQYVETSQGLIDRTGSEKKRGGRRSRETSNGSSATAVNGDEKHE